MNKYLSAILLFSVVGAMPSRAEEATGSVQEPGNVLVTAVINQVNKVSKKPVHKSPIEYRQAVERYIAHTKTLSVSSSKVGMGTMLSYEVELRYLLGNYGRFSTTTLLYRLRCAHKEMIKHNGTIVSQHYEQYEQMCSALLLQCAQILSENARKQLLNALHEVDDLLVYWRYQKNHPFRYCFAKSPHKWIMGKSQEQEVSNNIKKLERKQAELYTTLGKLTAHLHCFTESGNTYKDCYCWVEELLSVLSCIKTGPEKTTDGSRFDTIAAQLELKIKAVGNLKYASLQSVSTVKKSNHFVRNWVAYTTALAATGYAAYYHSKSLPIIFNQAATTATGFWRGVVVNPMSDLKTALVAQESNNSVSAIEKRVITLRALGLKIDADVEKELSKDGEKFEVFIFESLTAALHKAKQKLDPWFWGDDEVDVEAIMSDVKNKKLDSLNVVCDKLSLWNLDEKVDLEKARFLWGLYDVLNELKVYPEIIDTGVVPLIHEEGDLVADIGEFFVALAKDHKWTLKLATFSPLAFASFGITKVYQRAATRHHSPIRIALADVNSLLIESATPLDDYDYGKLVYLVHTLRNKASLLKDALCNEFLADVTKLESKRFTVKAKRGIVENMFNKYAFLGRIAV